MVESFVHMVGFNLLLVPKRREKIKGGAKVDYHFGLSV